MASQPPSVGGPGAGPPPGPTPSSAKPRRKTGLIIALVIIALVVALVAYLVPFYVGPGEPLLVKALTPYVNAQSFKGSGVIFRAGGATGGSRTTAEWAFTLAYERPNRIAFTLKSPVESHEYFCAGDTLYAHHIEVGRVATYPVAKVPLWDSVGICFGIVGGGWRGSVVAESDPKHGVRSVEKAGVGFVHGRPVQVLKLELDQETFHAPGPMFARLWLKPGASGVLAEEVSFSSKATRGGRTSNVTRITWREQELNPTLDPAMFNFTPPAKAIMVPVREEWLQTRQKGERQRGGNR